MPQRRGRRAARAWTALLAVWLVGSFIDAALAQTTATGNAAPNGFLLAQLSTESAYQAAMVEGALTAELPARFLPSPVRCVDIRATTATTTATTSASFDLLFLVGDDPFIVGTNNVSMVATNATLAVDVTALQTNVSLALASLLPSTGGGLSLRTLTPASVLALYGTLPSLRSVEAPPSSSAFLRVDMSFRNLLAPANLTQSLLFQTRRGVQRFLGLASLSQVTPTGPPVVPAASVLLLAQSFWVVLNNNASDATLDNRERLANLLIYGDPTRLMLDATSGTQRPAMFLDFAVDAAVEPRVDPTVLLTLPYVFSSLSVDAFPAGNAPAPEPTLPPGSVVVPATPTSELLARVRKRHVFQFATDASTTTVATSSACPSASAGGVCVKLQWNNTLEDMPFWVESIESLDTLAWNVAPGVAFCASHETPLPPLPSPTVPVGVSAVAWTLAPLVSSAPRVAFALNLRSLDAENATRVKVEIAADIRSALQAATTVTSIARRVAEDATSPLYETRSNVVVAYDVAFHAASSELALALTLQRNDVTQKDTAQPCAHCQNLYEWCALQAPCQALAHCVFRDGLEAAQTPATLLQQPSLLDAVVDVSPVVRRCLTAPGVALDALLLFASAVRCQLQRQCAVRRAADYALAGLDDRLLLWEAGDGVVQLNVSGDDANVTLRLLDTALCTLAPRALLVSSDAADDVVGRQCAHASHLGRVTALALNASLLELRFQDLVGPLPTLEGDVASVVTALPALRLRLERTDFATALPPVPAPAPAQPCRDECRALALDGCLRDLACVSFTDCVARTPLNDTETTIGDALLALFEQRQVGATLSLASAVARCQPAVASRAWRRLVRASACYARHDCALALQGVVLPPAPDGDAVVGKWRASPSSAVQRLLYEQQPEDAAPEDHAVPLAALDDGATPTTSSAGDAASLARALRGLLEFEGVDVRVVANATDAASGRRAVQWEIAYAFWLGALPRVVDASLAPRWRLVDMPLETPADYVVELVANVVDASAASGDPSTLSVVEMAAAVVS